MMSKEASTVQKSQSSKKSRPFTQSSQRVTDKNVNRFHHVLGTSSMTEKDIAWVLSQLLLRC